MFGALTLVGVVKIARFPLVLARSEYWAGLLGWPREGMLAEGKIGAADLTLQQIGDTAGTVGKIIRDATSAWPLIEAWQLSLHAVGPRGRRAASRVHAVVSR